MLERCRREGQQVCEELPEHQEQGEAGRGRQGHHPRVAPGLRRSQVGRGRPGQRLGRDALNPAARGFPVRRRDLSFFRTDRRTGGSGLDSPGPADALRLSSLSPTPLGRVVAGVEQTRFPPESAFGRSSEGLGQSSEGAGQPPGAVSRLRGSLPVARRSRRPLRRLRTAARRNQGTFPKPGGGRPEQFSVAGGVCRLPDARRQSSEGFGELSGDEFWRAEWRLRSDAEPIGPAADER
jgi:hypothetical protein